MDEKFNLKIFGNKIDLKKNPFSLYLSSFILSCFNFNLVTSKTITFDSLPMQECCYRTFGVIGQDSNFSVPALKMKILRNIILTNIYTISLAIFHMKAV